MNQDRVAKHENNASASVFVSYSHADKPFAAQVAARLTTIGHRVWIDEEELRVGDSLIERISEAITRADFLVAFVSPGSVGSNWCQREISLAMTGDVGQQGITVLPVRLDGAPVPPSLVDKVYLDATGLEAGVVGDKLNRSIQRHLAPPAPLPARQRPAVAGERSAKPQRPSSDLDDPIQLVGIDSTGITRPRNDNTPGSALYTVPFVLSHRPSSTWSQLMIKNWDRPPRFTSMHRPGIGRVEGDRFVLAGTTIDEVDQYHLETVKLAIAQTNSECEAIRRHRQQEDDRRRALDEKHEADVAAGLARLQSRLNSDLQHE